MELYRPTENRWRFGSGLLLAGRTSIAFFWPGFNNRQNDSLAGLKVMGIRNAGVELDNPVQQRGRAAVKFLHADAHKGLPFASLNYLHPAIRSRLPKRPRL